MQRPNLIERSRVIELGAGSGLLGLALLKYCPSILSYTFTDYSSMILNLLRQNVSLNFSEDQLDVSVPSAKCIRIEELDWSADAIDTHDQDVILATDVVYDPSVIEGLVKTIARLLETNRHASAYIANAIRNESTYAQFRQAVNESSLLDVQCVHTDAAQSIEILRISVRKR